MIKILSGYTDKGGSTTAFINLTNYLNSNGVDCILYGNQSWHLDRCKAGLMFNYTPEPDDRIITHFLQLNERPLGKRVVLCCHEKWWFPVGKVKQYWDTAVFLHEAHRAYHSDYRGDYVIIPNIKEPLVAIDKPELDLVAGIIGAVEDRKQTHVSIQRAMRDKCTRIVIFGKINDQSYFDNYVKPLLNPKIEFHGFTTNKQEMYNSIGRVYHSSKGEVACLVKDECFLTKTKFFGNKETENLISPLTNDEIMQLWKNVLEL